jgi:peptidoglycan/xylan/chitin deacetylase (PgdA/CDA1 family)
VEPTASAMGVAVAHPALNQAVPVLMYHHILPVPSNMIAISPSTFDAQMRYLHDNGYHAISMQQMQDFVLTGKRLPDKPVLITFDDGRMNQLTYGVPILKKYGFTATFFVVKKWVASSSSSFMHAAQIRQLAADGYDIESHTTNHMMLYRFHSKSTGKYETYASMKTRMWESTNGMRTWMADKLGISPVIALAYPGGGFDTYTWKLVQEAGYLLAFTTNDGYVRYKGQNQYDLPRFNTGARGTTQAHFVAVMRGAQRSKK